MKIRNIKREEVIHTGTQRKWGDEVFKEYLFEIIAALQTIGAHKYHDLLLKIMNDDFGDVRFPLDDNQIEQMQLKIEDANRAFWKNKGAEAEFRGAVTNFLITNLDASGHVFEGIDQS